MTEPRTGSSAGADTHRSTADRTAAARTLGYGPRTWDAAQFLQLGQLTTSERMPTVTLPTGRTPLPLPLGDALDVDHLTFVDPLTDRPVTGALLLDARLRADGLLVWADGSVRHESYRNGMRPDDHHLVHSCTKSLTALMIGVAVEEGRLDPSAPVSQYVPDLRRIDAWTDVTLQHVLDMATGLRSEEHYDDPGSLYWRYADDVGYYGPNPDAAGALGFVLEHLTERDVAPGTVFNYTSPITNLLPICLAAVYGRSATELYAERIYAHLGAEQPALVNCDHLGLPIVEGHLNLTLRDFARWALLMLHDGRGLDGRQIVPATWIDETCTPSPARRAAFARSDYADMFPGGEYHNQTWIIDPAEGRLAMLGIHGQFAYLDRSRQLAIVGMSSYPSQVDPLAVATMVELWSVIGAAI